MKADLRRLLRDTGTRSLSGAFPQEGQRRRHNEEVKVVVRTEIPFGEVVDVEQYPANDVYIIDAGDGP